MSSRIGWRRTPIPGRGLPSPESGAQRLYIRSIALLAIAVSVAYLAWRVTSTVDLSVWWLSVPLVLFEVHAFVGLVLFTFSLWDIDRRPATREVTTTQARIAVLIPTYNEGLEVLMPTVAAAIAMRLRHETWVLDDGDRREVKQLAADLGARYLARKTHEHAKAGNLNHAFGVVKADLVAVLDADHVASPDFLVRTLGYFDDPRVAVVQTPQDFYNRTSFEHEAEGAEEDRFHEQALFYRILQPGKNRWGAAFWCGTGAVVRMTALREIGGVATETITEDIHTTIRFHRRGWKSVYHNEVLARGLAAGDADTYQIQRLRWGTGAMQVLKLENPLLVSGLTLGQRLSYAATLLGWFDAWRSLAYLVAPLAVVLTGAVPIQAEPVTFFAAFISTFVLQQTAMRVLSRGCHRPVLSIMFELVRMTPNILATLTLLTHRRPRFMVTPKGRLGDGRRRTRIPLLLRTIAIASVLGGAWFALTLLGATPLHYPVPGAVLAAFIWLVVNFVLVLMASARVRSLRFAPERRSSVRFDTEFEGELGGLQALILDVSLTGARVFVPVWTTDASEEDLVVSIAGVKVELEVIVRSSRVLSGGGLVHGVEFAPGQLAAKANLALALFGTRIMPAADPVPVALHQAA